MNSVERIKELLRKEDGLIPYVKTLKKYKKNYQIDEDDFKLAFKELKESLEIYPINALFEVTYINIKSKLLRRMQVTAIKENTIVFKELDCDEPLVLDIDKDKLPRSLMYLDEVLIFPEINTVQVIKITKRNTKLIFGEIKISSLSKKVYVYTSSLNNQNKYLIRDVIQDLKQGDKVIAEITDYITREAKVVRILNTNSKRYETVISSLLENGFKENFSKEVYDEADSISNNIEIKKTKERKDYRQLLTITIDGDDSKDFDDAISLVENKDSYTVYVHIADVSEYVKDGTQLDIEARERTCSVYLPENVFPMLPEVLSNGVCSLNPKEERYTLTAEIEIDKKGKIIKGDIKEGIIVSDYRMTYAKTQDILDSKKEAQEEYKDIVQFIKLLEKVSDILKQEREKCGVLNFTTQENKFIIKNSEIVKVVPYEYKKSNEIIENFMILANEFVSRYMSEKKMPCIYRVHDEPDMMKLKESVQNARVFDFKVNIQDFQDSFNREIEKLKDKELIKIISYMFLRAMSKAKYTESNIGHYGLGLDYYSHFTSPIRRYPDLEIHRIIKSYIRNNNKLTNDELIKYKLDCKNIAKESSKKEALALKVERDMDDYYLCEYMKDKIGKEYEGRIVSVTNFGLFVEFLGGVEGSLRFDSLPKDYYIKEGIKLIGKRTGKTYTLADKIKVIIKEVNTNTRRITLSIPGVINNGNTSKFKRYKNNKR